MKKITIYECNDGTRFDSEERHWDMTYCCQNAIVLTM